MIGTPRVHHRLTDSTNERAKELAAAGAPHGTLVTADEQSAGRGRQGRVWTAPARSAVLMSLVLRELDELLPIAAAVAVAEALPAGAAIKWPNDVWIDRRKVAGVLIEARPQDGWAVIGVGLNVDTDEKELPPELRDVAGSLRMAAGRRIDRDVALDTLLDRLAVWVSRLDDAAGIAAAFRERDALHGKRIAWNAGDSRHEGEALGIEDDGALVVFTDDGERVRLDAGEVHLG